MERISIVRKPNRNELSRLLVELRETVAKIADVAGRKSGRKKACAGIEEVGQQIVQLAASLDPVLRPASSLDSADPSTAGRFVALALLAQERYPLSKVPNFYGAGVYALYYTGRFRPYLPLSGSEHPIYVGKADPAKIDATSLISQGTRLSRRLREHARSIERASGTLRVEDFECRFLVVRSGYQKAAEDYLIHLFMPIWNSEVKLCFGLGKHGDSAKTRGNKRSPWDTLHPGRGWAGASKKDQKLVTKIKSEIGDHFQGNPPYRDLQTILKRFFGDMRQLDGNVLGPDRGARFPDT